MIIPYRYGLKLIAALVLTCVISTVLAGCSASVPPPLKATPPDPPISTALPSATAVPTLTPTPAPTSTPTPLPTATPLMPVQVETFPITSLYLGNSRDLTVYLPPDYQTSPERRFKVLYSNDGQDLPVMALEQYLNSFYDSHKIEQIIVVGIPASDNRVNEYGTGPIKDVSGLGANAAAYLNFLFKEVIPFINSNFRTLTGPQDTGFMGWSLGGLTAFYATWQHPEVFGIVAAFSGSFWWRTNVDNLQDLLNSRVIQKMVRDSSSRPALRMWFSAGTNEDPNDRDKNGVIDMVQDTTDLIDELKQKGYQDGIDYRYVQIEGGTHDPSTWATVLPDFLQWAFPPQ
jgi:enterochelin esterase family protein